MPTPPGNDAADTRSAPDEEMPTYEGIVVPAKRTRLQTWVGHFRDNYKSIIGLTLLAIACAAFIVWIVLGGRRNTSRSTIRGNQSSIKLLIGPNDDDVIAVMGLQPCLDMCITGQNLAEVSADSAATCMALCRSSTLQNYPNNTTASNCWIYSILRSTFTTERPTSRLNSQPCDNQPTAEVEEGMLPPPA
mmetsp:Transcript_29571/g.66767  ORF Transcript_29571/g.66767 Transcript_29571/m.66767 type:complete len:190 (-) Transcript_29571:135-704(-)